MSPSFEQHMQQQVFMLADGLNRHAAAIEQLSIQIEDAIARISMLEAATGRSEKGNSE